MDCLASRFLLHVRFASGATKLIASTAHGTTAREGPLREDSYFHGEVFDARREQRGWSEPEFNATAGWWPARKMEPNVSSTMSSALLQPIRKAERYEPVSVKRGPLGVLLFDFGVNHAGFCVLKLPSCAKGTPIQLRHAETTTAEGELFNQFTDCAWQDGRPLGSQCAMQQDTYICSGAEGGEVYEPVATYHGHRFVEMRGWGHAGPVPSDLLTSFLVHTDVAEISTIRFDSFDPAARNILNDINAITLNSQKSNYHSVPTDCPTR